MLKNDCLVAKIGAATAENEPSKVLPNEGGLSGRCSGLEGRKSDEDEEPLTEAAALGDNFEADNAEKKGRDEVEPKKKIITRAADTAEKNGRDEVKPKKKII